MRREQRWTPIVILNDGFHNAGMRRDRPPHGEARNFAHAAYAPRFPDAQPRRRSDIHFSAGVAIALALPALFGPVW
jgi:hypothetical protein